MVAICKIRGQVLLAFIITYYNKSVVGLRGVVGGPTFEHGGPPLGFRIDPNLDNTILTVCVFVCMSASKIAKKVANGFR